MTPWLKLKKLNSLTTTHSQKRNSANIPHRSPNTVHRTSVIPHWSLKIQHRSNKIDHPTSGTGHPTSHIGHPTTPTSYPPKVDKSLFWSQNILLESNHRDDRPHRTCPTPPFPHPLPHLLGIRFRFGTH